MTGVRKGQFVNNSWLPDGTRFVTSMPSFFLYYRRRTYFEPKSSLVCYLVSINVTINVNSMYGPSSSCPTGHSFHMPMTSESLPKGFFLRTYRLLSFSEKFFYLEEVRLRNPFSLDLRNSLSLLWLHIIEVSFRHPLSFHLPLQYVLISVKFRKSEVVKTLESCTLCHP